MLQWKSCTTRPVPDLGWWPMIMLDSDPRPVREQIEERYRHGGGWNPVAPGKFKLISLEPLVVQYPGDPPMEPLARAQLHDETLYMFPYAFLGVVQKDGSWEVARID